MNQRQVVCRGVSVEGTHEPFVTDIDLEAPAGRVTVVAADPGVAQVALALAIGGRIDLLAGSVSVGGSTDRADLQMRTRIVDAADVTAPEEALPLGVVVAEELALAERPSSRRDVAAFLAERGLLGVARHRWDSLPPATRTSLLVELGSWHPGVRVLVLTGPDRHGGPVDEWVATAQSVAEAGLTVIVICAPATAAALTAAGVPGVDTTAADPSLPVPATAIPGVSA